MKRANPDLRCRFANRFAEPVAHLSGGFVGKGERQYIIGRYFAFLN